MSKSLRAIFFVPLVTISVGCSPIVYKTIISQDNEGLTKFNLQSSAIVINEVKANENTSLTVTSVPTQSKKRYAIEANDYFFWKSTNLNVEKYPNTDIIKSLTIDTEDHRKEFITSATSIAVTIAAFGLTASNDKEAYPYILDTEDLLTKDKLGDRQGFSATSDKSLNSKPVNIYFGKIPDDAIETNKFPFTKNSKVYAFSACRTAKVSFDDGTTRREVSINVADPNFIQTIKIPDKGSITMHSGCGVDTKSEKSSVNSDAEVLSHLVEQVKSALDSKK